MWRRREIELELPPVSPQPVSADNVLARLDSIVDRLEGVYERVDQQLNEALRRLPRADGDREDD